MARAAFSPAKMRQQHSDDSFVMKVLFEQQKKILAELSALYVKLDAEALAASDYQSTLEAMTPAMPTTFDG